MNRVCARDDFQAPAGAVWLIQELHKKKIAVFDDGTTGPRGGADEFEKKAETLGATVLRYVVRAGDKDFRPILGTIPKDVDAIYASIWAPDAALPEPIKPCHSPATRSGTSPLSSGSSLKKRVIAYPSGLNRSSMQSRM